MSLPQLVAHAAAVSAVLAELDVPPNEPVLITLPDGPGGADCAIDQHGSLGNDLARARYGRSEDLAEPVNLNEAPSSGIY